MQQTRSGNTDASQAASIEPSAPKHQRGLWAKLLTACVGNVIGYMKRKGSWLMAALVAPLFISGCGTKFPILSIEIVNGWDRSDIHEASLRRQDYLSIGGEEVAHLFTKTTARYRIQARVNPFLDSVYINVVFTARSVDDRLLTIQGAWKGPPMDVGQYVDLPKQPNSYAFAWAPDFSGEHYSEGGRWRHFSAVSFKHQMDDYAREVAKTKGSNIQLRIFDQNGVLVGEETVHVRIWLNGYARRLIVP
jgi:hypothetical protein